jgi:hypothetical protein
MWTNKLPVLSADMGERQACWRVCGEVLGQLLDIVEDHAAFWEDSDGEGFREACRAMAAQHVANGKIALQWPKEKPDSKDAIGIYVALRVFEKWMRKYLDVLEDAGADKDADTLETVLDDYQECRRNIRGDPLTAKEFMETAVYNFTA